MLLKSQKLLAYQAGRTTQTKASRALKLNEKLCSERGAEWSLLSEHYP